ncbi:MAG: hypothetical protein FJ291_34385, partial [Planctomycetes bacterium]|nr:hypothetical protein [Planctomycetota bacterium]
MITTKVIFDCPLPPLVVAAGALAAACVVLAFQARDAAHLRGMVRRVILALYAAAALMLGGIVLGPKIIRTWPDPQKPLCSVMVDGSRSMLLTDSYGPDELKGKRQKAKGKNEKE